MLKSGLVSITFRPFTPARIIQMVEESGLECIEWGGDIHVPHGDLKTARLVGRQCADAGISLPAYGSYYRAGSKLADNPTLNAVLDTAAELGTKDIRIWAGNSGSDNLSDAQRSELVDCLCHDSAVAAKYGVTLCLEYHGGTLTDSDASVKQLLTELADTAIKFYWQPAVGKTTQSQLDSLTTVVPRLAHIHAFQWSLDVSGNIVKCPFATGRDDWQRFLAEIAKVAGERAVMLEFVKDNSAEQFIADAATLRQLLVESSTVLAR